MKETACRPTTAGVRRAGNGRLQDRRWSRPGCMPECANWQSCKSRVTVVPERPEQDQLLAQCHSVVKLNHGDHALTESLHLNCHAASESVRVSARPVWDAARPRLAVCQSIVVGSALDRWPTWPRRGCPYLAGPGFGTRDLALLSCCRDSAHAGLDMNIFVILLVARANNLQSFRCKARPLRPRQRPQRSISRTFYASNRWSSCGGRPVARRGSCDCDPVTGQTPADSDS